MVRNLGATDGASEQVIGMDDVQTKLLQARVLIAHLVFDLAADHADPFGESCIQHHALGSCGPMRVAQ
jgi:hypothetical protein